MATRGGPPSRWRSLYVGNGRRVARWRRGGRRAVRSRSSCPSRFEPPMFGQSPFTWPRRSTAGHCRRRGRAVRGGRAARGRGARRRRRRGIRARGRDGGDAADREQADREGQRREAATDRWDVHSMDGAPCVGCDGRSLDPSVPQRSAMNLRMRYRALDHAAASGPPRPMAGHGSLSGDDDRRRVGARDASGAQELWLDGWRSTAST